MTDLELDLDFADLAYDTADRVCPVCFGAGGWQHPNGLIIECRCGAMTGGAA